MASDRPIIRYFSMLVGRPRDAASCSLYKTYFPRHYGDVGASSRQRFRGWSEPPRATWWHALSIISRTTGVAQGHHAAEHIRGGAFAIRASERRRMPCLRSRRRLRQSWAFIIYNLDAGCVITEEHSFRDWKKRRDSFPRGERCVNTILRWAS